MTLRRVGAAAAFAACALVAACSAASILTGGARDDAGLIMFYGETTQVTVPDTITHGVPFDVSFTTFAGGCTRAVAHDDLSVAGGDVQIRPYDRNSGGEVCTADLMFLKHVVSVRLDTPGSYVIHLIGQQRGNATASNNGAAEITRSITVR